MAEISAQNQLVTKSNSDLSSRASQIRHIPCKNFTQSEQCKFLNQPRVKPIPSCSFAHFRYPALSILSIRCPNFRCEACKYSHSLFCPPIFQSTDPKFYTRSSLRLLTGANKFPQQQFRKHPVHKQSKPDRSKSTNNPGLSREI